MRPPGDGRIDSGKAVLVLSLENGTVEDRTARFQHLLKGPLEALLDPQADLLNHFGVIGGLGRELLFDVQGGQQLGVPF